MASKYFHKALEKVSPEIKIFTNKSFDIIDQVHHILEQQGITQRELAQKLGKSESEISKWLSGGHNITLKTISKLEAALGEDILVTPLRYEGKYNHTQPIDEVAKIVKFHHKNEQIIEYKEFAYTEVSDQFMAI